MIEILIVAAGVAGAGACGAAAARQARRVDVEAADAIVTRAVGPAGYPRGRLVAGEVLAVVDRPARPARPAGRRDTCPRCGVRPVAAGALAIGPDGTTVPVCSGCLQPASSADAAIWAALQDDGQAGACHGRLVRHEDGSLSCHGGRDDCWPGVRDLPHTAPEIGCRSLSHGCGTCQSAGGAR